MLKELREVRETLEASKEGFRLIFIMTRDEDINGISWESRSREINEALAKLDGVIGRLSGEDFQEQMAVAIAEEYLLIPKNTPFEDVSDRLMKAAIKVVRGDE